MLKTAFAKFLTHVLYGSPNLHETPGQGGGASGGNSGMGMGGSLPVGGGNGGGAAAPTSYKLTADSMVDLGDGKPVKWADLTHADNGRFVERDRFNRGVEFLKGEAAKLTKAWEKYHAGDGPRPQQPNPQQQQQDPFANVRDMPVIDGRTIEQLYKQGFGPIAQLVAQQQQTLAMLQKQVGGLGKGFGSIAERDQANDFESFITKSYSEVGPVKGLPDGVAIDSNDPHMREIAKDLYLSHERESWKPGEFTKQLKARIEANVAFVRAMDKKATEAARNQKKVWLNPNRGNANPNGKTPFRFQKGTDIARQFFGDAAPQAT